MTQEDVDRLLGYGPDLVPAILVTIGISLASITLATAIGILVATTGRSPSRAVRTLGRAYVEVGRTIPELVQIYIWFYLLPEFGIVLSPPVAGVIAIGLAFGAYLAEVFRAGVEAVEATQWEASHVLGMSRLMTWRRVILPQAAIHVLPVWTSYFVSAFKATALLSIITVDDVMRVVHQIASLNFRYFELFTIALFIYFVIGYVSILLLRRLENRWARILRPTTLGVATELGAQGI